MPSGTQNGLRMTAAATTGVILGAIYMLWMIRRVIFGALTNPANEHLADLNAREICLLTPILFLIVLMGVYPQPFLQRMKPAIEWNLKRITTVTSTPVSTDHEPSGESNNDER